ncbi:MULTISPECIES: ABC transporter ATP-binding protein [unclassified Paenibacillus]|uniref:ABC transporter ATP-binding protein n=1 Tax=unclassified Paenibacillus TaxID=185978 RepID=UPI0009539FCE|nr:MULTISPECIES: ABC transporter ATP-binding protein [unclassified Paenibacillus]ASS67330.1 ABC transporter ATP-binding protein [Paenibacillus sp. RUD330]SIQ81142.1 ABC-2 type transport system ATP-binding protein/lipopolysaccharide transport system ATP-binding protein [Paenibacillus sp. RU4X]SIR02568.1 ABC-2 type transport system ATP-binding protein/lipopolysaccharide transport system ATP-binding protein [Paenibacillus sp. RU4T]
MKNNPVISINNVSKKFKIYKDKPLTLKEKLLRLRSDDYSDFKAVDGVSLTVHKGETVSLIGHNGCGKSTLLKLITKILYPDQGQIKVNGRISSLIELGAGFHPDFTGRENIYTNASIFGLSKKAIDEKLDDIIGFSELGHFIDNPVRTYSSGMYMRLAFSVAINVDPEILLIDEILSVGDENFQKKCFEKIENFKKSGATIVIVTHDLGTVEKISDRVVWMNAGKVVAEGDADQVLNLYKQHMNEKFVQQKQIEFNENAVQASKEKSTIAKKELQVISDDNHWGSREVEITDVRIINKNGEKTNAIIANESMSIEIDYKINKEQKEYIFGMGFYNSDLSLIYGNNTEIDKLKLKDLPQIGSIQFHIPTVELLSGTYKLNVAIVDESHRALDFYKYYMDFSIVSTDKSVGSYSISHQWKVKS